jgi:alpha-ketoglutarate-dependent taurine dioxygenase
MHITEIKNGVAVEIENFDIRNIDENSAKQIYSTLTNNIIVVLKHQPKDPGHFTNFVLHLGEIANFKQFYWHPINGKMLYDPSQDKEIIDPKTWPDPSTYPVQRVTGKKVDGEISGIFGTGMLDWHANLNGLDRADGVALQGYKDCEGTSTTWLNTAKVYDEMPKDLISRCKNIYCEYTYAPEIWASGLPEKQKAWMLKNANTYKMWLLQKNVANKKGLYFYTNNRCKIISPDAKLYGDLYDFMFQDKFMYQHNYEVGDIVLSDQILSLHKRDQNDPNILAKRILHRITFKISNYGTPTWLEKNNKL